MRILLYGMQSSGASFLTLLLAQKPGVLAVVDLAHHTLAPALTDTDAPDVLVKCVVTTAHALQEHIASFHPDKTVLVVRHPAQNYQGLKKKEYANASGDIDDKFRVLETHWQNREQFDAVFVYEDLVVRPHYLLTQFGELMNWEYTPKRFHREADEILRFTCEHSEWCREKYGTAWKFGKADARRITEGSMGVRKCKLLKGSCSKDEMPYVRELAPTLTQFYLDFYAEHVNSRLDLRLASYWGRVLESPLALGVKAVVRRAKW